MNKRLVKFTRVAFATIFMTLSCLVQEAGAIPVPNTTVPVGEFKITPSQAKDSIIIEANETPVIPLLQEIARQTNRKIIISDEAQQKGKEIKFITYKPMELTLESALDFFSHTSLSWGKVGQDTYLVVPRQESPAEVAARKAEIDRIIKSLDEKSKDKPKQNPMQEPFKGRFWLLSPPQQ